MFKEAKVAYRERKAEIVAGRQADLEEKRVRRTLQAYIIEDGRSSTQSKDKHRSSKSRHQKSRPATHRHSSGSSLASGTNTIYPASDRNFDHLHIRPQDAGSMSIPHDPSRQQLIRSQTAREGSAGSLEMPLGPRRSVSTPDLIDMDLAYGEIPPPLPVRRLDDETELRGLVSKVKMLLEEADCLQYSATAIIASLQKNPDAMAAVALTLAEISNIASKMAPGVLAAMKGSAPAVFALLASPQFLIAVGVGVGVTVVALGGYKIIKKIKAKQAGKEAGMDEMLDVGDLGGIDNWRRGIAEEQAQSVGTSVDGEFITPQAAALSMANLKEHTSRESARSSRASSYGSQHAPSSKSGTLKSSKTAKPRKEKREKKPSPLRLMFS